VSTARWGAGFANAARFVVEIEAAAAGSGQLRPATCCRRRGVPAGALPQRRSQRVCAAGSEDFCLSIWISRRTPSLKCWTGADAVADAPFQVIFVRNVRQLYTRGAKKEEFAALDHYFRSPNPQALLIFVADFVRIPSDIRRMEMDDKNRFERLTETLASTADGGAGAGERRRRDALAVTTAHEADVRMEPDAARQLVDALSADMMMVPRA